MLQYMRFALILSLLIASLSNVAQNETIGLLYVDDQVSDGYTLFTPRQSNEVFLIDNCGKVINSWMFNERPRLTCYLLENGNLLRAGLDSITIQDWNGNTLWSYAHIAAGFNQHHDIEPLPNGNVLLLVKDVLSNTEAIDEGRDPATSQNGIELECIVEIQPNGLNGANVVWEWCMRDHLIQDFDSTKLNYGTVAQHPELIDFNYPNNNGNDWVHANGLDYNPTLDQIVFSSRHLNEIYIIDHSTTTQEAASHQGGNAGLGGDYLWRWGNPEVYRQGSPANRKLFQQHDPKWVLPGYPDAGKISLFNNGLPGNPSAVGLVEPVIQNGAYLMNNNQFEPVDFDWTWAGDILGVTVQQSSRSGASSLSNGNIMLCETNLGRISEINKNGDLLWSYVSPVGITYYLQTTPSANLMNDLFRGEKYAPDYPGFDGLVLTPGAILENINSISDSCAMLFASIKEVNLNVQVTNPVIGGRIEFGTTQSFERITIHSNTGALLFEKSDFSGTQLNTRLARGFYFVRFEREGNQVVHKLVFE